MRIAPRRVDIGSSDEPLLVDQIALGGVPRGATVVVKGSAEHDTVEVQNSLAGHGYESVVLPPITGRLDPAFEVGVDQIAQALRHLATRGWAAEQVGVVAYGVAGWVALHAAVAFDLGAAVSVSPTPAERFEPAAAETVMAAAPVLRTPWLGLVAGSADQAGALDEALALVSAPRAGSTYARVVSYPGVPQAFYVPTGQALGRAARFDAWQRIAEWLDQRVVPRPTELELQWRSRLQDEPVRGSRRSRK